MSAPQDFVPPRPAASVILCRRDHEGARQVYLVQRSRRSSFLGASFVFPGGAIDAEDGDPRIAAARELFEEAGVLLSRTPVDARTLGPMRRALHDDPSAFADLLRAQGLDLALDALHLYSCWRTPSVERKRFSALFYWAELPEGQTPCCDQHETVDDIWLDPREVFERAVALHLPPPQIRTLFELAAHPLAQPPAGWGTGHAGPPEILPRVLPSASPLTLVLPWDPEYGAGLGEALPIVPDHPLARGPSRFLLDGNSWRHTDAAGRDARIAK